MQKSQENFEDFNVYKKQQTDDSLRQNREFGDSIFLRPGEGIGNFNSELNNFAGLPGVRKTDPEEADDDFYKVKDEEAVDIFKQNLEPKVTAKHWLSLLACSILTSSMSPFMICMKESIFYKMFWMYIVVFIISTILMAKMKVPGLYGKNSFKKFYDGKMIKNLMLPSVCSIAWMFCVIFSCHYDNVSHSLVFANTHTFMITIYRLFTGEKSSIYEKMGVLVSFLGLLVIAYDDNTLSYEHSIYNLRKITVADKILKGNLTGLIGSGFTALFFVKMKKQMRQYHVVQKLYVTSLMGVPMFLILSIALATAEIEEHLLWSFLNLKNFTLIVLVASLSVMMSNYFLYILNNVFNRMTVSIAMQLQPLFASMLVYLLGQQNLPGLVTIFGILCCIPGLILLKIEQNYKETDDFISCSRNSDSVLPSFDSETKRGREMVLI